MSVLECEARFAELSKYAPQIVADEQRKVKKFIMGLKPSLRTRLLALGHRSMEEALSVACMQETEMEVYLEEKRASLKSPLSAFQRCGDKNHKIRVCPKMAQQTAAAAAPAAARLTPRAVGRLRAQARVFALARDEVELVEHVTEDWLEEHYALMDCRQKLIIFQIPGKEEFVHPLPKSMSGKFFISSLKAAPMLSKGCSYFLASVVQWLEGLDVRAYPFKMRN
ncbi:hypothetical protein Taro_039684 [Colocasia esculenta]|uniref:Uncharacterized protein n=1 Tax=Colocasia esculenta TaxID=4460 RepID=A0A843WH83_COLES|nr:hypothetical protein [Colocasia esculenta]